MARYLLNKTYIYMIYKNNRIEITLYVTGNYSALSVKGRLSVVLRLQDDWQYQPTLSIIAL